nr:sugar-binding domain-containing protein [uncultured Sphaerochaeta sp.]
MVRYETELMVTVSKLYYLTQLKQEEIAARLKISRALVSLILNEAKRVGIVEFRINDPQSENKELAGQLQTYFPSIQFIVIPSSSKDEAVLREFIASRSVEVINDQLENGQTLGISWGRTCYAVMSTFTPKTMHNLSNVVPLVGGSNKNLPRFQLNELVRVFAGSMRATPHFIHAPALAESQEDYELYMRSASMRQISKMWEKIDLAIMSVGPPPIHEEFDGSPVQGSYIEKWLGKDNTYNLPVGNLCARNYNIYGEFVHDEIQDRIVSIPFETMKRIPKIIAIAAGLDRVYSVVGALRTGIVKTLVIDELSAQAVVDIFKREKSASLDDDVKKLYNIK